MSLTIKLHVFTSHSHCLNLNFPTKPTPNGFTSYNPKIRPKPIYHSDPFVSIVYNKKPNMHSPSRSVQAPIKSSLIEPDGGKLVDLVVPETDRAQRVLEAQALPKVSLTKIDLEWVHVISEGWASPLRGFMREDEYLQSLHFNSLRTKDGSVVNMSLPIALAIDDETKERTGSSTNVGLVGPNGDLIAILRSIEIYKHNKEERIARTWGTTAPGLPYVEEVITSAGNWLIGGDLEVLEPIKYNDGLDHYRLSPQQLRKEFDRRQADAVFAFQLRNPARINAGANFYIVGRDPAGMGHPTEKRDLYDPDHGKKVLSMAPGLEKLNIWPFRVAAYDTVQKKMAFFDPSRAKDFLFISGTKMRNYAKTGENPPDGFMCPGGWKVLVNYYESLQTEEASQQPAVVSA
ncbi:sulfate adenylyltransferase, prokaryotic-type [Parasponia andersonii]|uniref:Sulfate adenylyltransferase, prokaryotic-type n=1 Tax=Parasponia andersonii TaxID=3476 RepID=A0A2P5DBT7_PARAD|nr:sulfate adenylyltransferase, prokaryotic-type [Parasponia andersonii]